MAIVGISAVMLLGLMVRASAADLWITQAFNALHVGAVAEVTNGIYRGLEPMWALAIACIVSAYFWWSRKSVAAGLVVGTSIVLTWLPVPILKMIFGRPRPAPQLLDHPFDTLPRDWAFPSGHTAFITALAVVLFTATIGTALHRAMRVICPVLVLIIAGTVLIIGVHFPTDVLASVIWSGTVAPAVWALTALTLRRFLPKVSEAQSGVPKR